ncbi:MAG: 30S ribosomal protein S12 [Halobacteriovorax sp.]|jgi:small subunit ribosomal protein S12|nr:30S ribosomal protein S12 [Halobacteriovorax sp.]|tara:strand:+ start:24554 stop:24964 length:411 start_codon:yes stop_codon:yes gene_type:complete
MPTKNQLLSNSRKLRRTFVKRKLLEGNPQKKGICIRISVMAPNKPNSAKRKVVRAQILSTNKRAWVYIPGEGGHTLQIYSNILIRGGRVQDLPVQYKAVRNKYDLGPVEKRMSSRSKYGRKQDINKWKKVKLKTRY